MQLYAEYIREREGSELYTDPSNRGFLTYREVGNECYIVDIYVVPEARKQGVAAEMADKVAEITCCRWLTGSVCPQAQGATESLKVLVAYGMKLVKSDTNLIWFAKEMGNG